MSFSFKFAGNFLSLNSADFNNAYDIIKTQFYGVGNLWQGLPADIRASKRELLYNFLVAWYLASTNPENLKGVDSNGLPLTSKSIGGVNIGFEQLMVQSGMEIFKTNTFGLQALQMIQGAPERYKLYGG